MVISILLLLLMILHERFLKTKDHVFEHFKKFYAMAERERLKTET